MTVYSAIVSLLNSIKTRVISTSFPSYIPDWNIGFVRIICPIGNILTFLEDTKTRIPFSSENVTLHPKLF